MKLWFGTAAVLLASACSGQGDPNQDDIRAALKQAGNRGGPKAEKLACKRSPERPGVICDYRAPACNRYTGTCGSVRPFTGRFLHANGRWQLVEDLTPRATPDPVTQPLPGAPVASPTPTDEPGFVPEPEAPVAPPPEPTAPPRPSSTFQPSAPEPAAPPEFDEDDAAPRRDLSRRDLRQISRWATLNARCGINSSDDADREACFERDDVAQRMRRRGLCYGGGDAATVARWHRCD